MAEVVKGAHQDYTTDDSKYFLPNAEMVGVEDEQPPGYDVITTGIEHMAEEHIRIIDNYKKCLA